MAQAKNTAGRKTSANKAKNWVVPVEATITGYVTVAATDEDEAFEAIDAQMENLEFDVLGGKSIDGDEFVSLFSRTTVTAALVLEDIFVAKPTRKTRAKKATANKASPTTAKKGRSRGKATNPSTGKEESPEKEKAKASTGKAKGRARGGSKS